LEQNFRGDPVSQELLLGLNEGKTIEFEVTSSESGQIKREIIPGKIIRSGSGQVYPAYGGYATAGMQPIIEVNGNSGSACRASQFFPPSPMTRS